MVLPRTAGGVEGEQVNIHVTNGHGAQAQGWYVSVLLHVCMDE